MWRSTEFTSLSKSKGIEFGRRWIRIFNHCRIYFRPGNMELFFNFFFYIFSIVFLLFNTEMVEVVGIRPCRRCVPVYGTYALNAYSLSTKGIRKSSVLKLNWLSLNIPVSAPEDLAFQSRLHVLPCVNWFGKTSHIYFHLLTVDSQIIDNLTVLNLAGSYSDLSKFNHGGDNDLIITALKTFWLHHNVSALNNLRANS